MLKKNRPKQNHKKYKTTKYESFNLWLDYWEQLKLIEESNATSILEIGVGTGTLGVLLKKRKYKYKSADIESSLDPNFVCDITSIPVKRNSFDTVCAFQVLEHIPYNEFEKSLIEMSRIAKKKVIISIPYSTIYISFAFSMFYSIYIKKIFSILKMKPFEPKFINFYIPTFFLINLE